MLIYFCQYLPGFICRPPTPGQAIALLLMITSSNNSLTRAARQAR